MNINNTKSEISKGGNGGCDYNNEEIKTPVSSSMVPQLWNPRHMLGLEEFKVYSENNLFEKVFLNLKKIVYLFYVINSMSLSLIFIC
jgi:hypothetical protein